MFVKALIVILFKMHVLLKYLLLLYLKKLIRTNKLSLSIEIEVPAACFVKTLIVIYLKRLIRTNNSLFLSKKKKFI